MEGLALLPPPCPPLSSPLKLHTWHANNFPTKTNQNGGMRGRMQSICSGDLCPKQSVHFVGIGGAGLSALASFALLQGWQVSGSDVCSSRKAEELRSAGVRVHIGHSAHHLWDEKGTGLPDAVVISSVIPADNVEVIAAQMLGVPVYKRDAWLAKLTETYDLIAVSGSHGKSTTAAMLAIVLHDLRDDISAVVGADVLQFPDGGNAMLGEGCHFVLEADEYDGCFLSLSPVLILVTNIEWEHVDLFPDEASLRDIFMKFIMQLKPGGTLIVCGDSAGSMSLVTMLREREWLEDYQSVNKDLLSSEANCCQRIVTYGLGLENEWCAVRLICNEQGGTDYIAVHAGKPIATVSLKLPGSHNVLNSLGVIAAVVQLALQGSMNQQLQNKVAKDAGRSLGNFVGIRRRFEFVGRVRRCQIYDDYAHHPTEVRATLQAARQRFNQDFIWVVFQPHTYSRLTKLLQDFATAFSAANYVIVTEIYAAREENVWNISGSDLACSIIGPSALYIPKLDDVLEKLTSELAISNLHDADKIGDIIIITLGAGDVTSLGPRLLHGLSTKAGLMN
eukprot:c26214_g1_i1 orf=11-1696(+)